ncbi:MAG TPA: condensation domain-containing protein, partial [Rhizomicrobium sp.]|nr:condensation domain-containing protein [Rhizomicrobium sp.]
MLSNTEQHARSILGLIERAPAALPPRVEQLWRMDGFAGNVPFTNPMFVPLGTAPDMGLVYEAVARTVDRHPALHTRLAVQNGRGIQIVEAWKASRIPVVEILRRQLEEDRPDAPPSPIGEFTKGDMDLFAQDGFRACAFRDEDGGVNLGFLAHGFYSDAWSSQVLLRDFRAFHSALTGGPGAAPGETASYMEYAQSQRRALDKELPVRLAFWRRRLGSIPRTILPYDHQTGA